MIVLQKFVSLEMDLSLQYSSPSVIRPPYLPRNYGYIRNNGLWREGEFYENAIMVAAAKIFFTNLAALVRVGSVESGH